MRASTPFGGGECRWPLHKECLKYLGHKGNPRVTLGTCDTNGEEREKKFLDGGEGAKIGLPWMEVHITPLATDSAVSSEHKCRRVGSPRMSSGVRSFGDLTISMAEYEGLALVTHAKIEK